MAAPARDRENGNLRQSGETGGDGVWEDEGTLRDVGKRGDGGAMCLRRRGCSHEGFWLSASEGVGAAPNVRYRFAP